MQFQRLNKDVDSAAAAAAAAASAAGKESSTIRWQRLGCLFISFAAVVVVVVVVDVGFKHFMTFISGDAAPLPTAICMPVRVYVCENGFKIKFPFDCDTRIHTYVCTCVDVWMCVCVWRCALYFPIPIRSALLFL